MPRGLDAIPTCADMATILGETSVCYDAACLRYDGQIILGCQELLPISVSAQGISMSEPFGFQLSGSAPDMYERYIVATLTATLAQTS